MSIMRVWNGASWQVVGGAMPFYVWDGSTYAEVTRPFLGSVDPTTVGFTGTDGDAWIPIPDGDYVTQTEFDEQGPSGRQLAYASSIAYQSGIAGSTTDITGLSINFTVGNRPVKVRMYLPCFAGTASATSAFVSITDGSGNGGQTVLVSITAASATTGVVVEELITTPGDYVRKGRITRFTGSGTLANGYPPSGDNVFVSCIEAVER